MRNRSSLVVIGGSALFCAGLLAGAAALTACNRTTFQDSAGATIKQVDQIRNDKNLTAQEKRDALAALGFDDVTINALLKSERTGNQYGGTLRTAYNKVVDGQLDQLTPDEVQLYGDATAVATISDDSAQAIVSLFVDEDIQTATELGDLLVRSDVNLSDKIDKTTLTQVFVDFDPNTIIDKLP